MILTLILFILILGLTVLVHECGHFIFAKIVGVHVYEFAIGMGPKLLSKKGKDGTEYSIRLIPVGGFVTLAGEEVDVDLDKQEGKNLQDKTLFQRFLVMFMGVGFNFIFAFLVLFIIGICGGATDMNPTISSITPNSPAAIAGIEAGDRVLEINNSKVTYIDDILLYLTIEDLSKPVTFEIRKNDGTIENYKITAAVEKKEGDKNSYIIGIGLQPEKTKGLLPSIKFAFQKQMALFKQMFIVLGGLFTGKVSIKSLTGPVGIYSVVGSMKNQGVLPLLYILVVICINVGIVNLLPFPAFDGGRILFLIIAKIKGSPISSKVENTIHSIGFILLILLMVYVTFNDILNLFK